MADYYARFSRFKNGPFHKRQEGITLCDSKRSSFITDFEFRLDTPILIIARFVMTQARGCKQRYKSHLLLLITHTWYSVITWHLLGYICNNTIIYEVV